MEAHRTRIARIFGSVFHGLDTDRSDLDILIDPTPETTLFDIGAIRHELIQLLGVPVDRRTPNALPDKFRARALVETRPIQVVTGTVLQTIWPTSSKQSSASTAIPRTWTNWLF